MIFIWGNYSNKNIKIVSTLYKKYFSSSKSGNRFSREKMLDNNTEELPELEEPRRPPYKCASFYNKYNEAEKTVEYFNRARSSLDSLLNLFEEQKDDHPQVPVLLRTFSNIRKEYHDKVDKRRKHPLIVFEGLDGSGKSSVGKRFAEKVGAAVMPTPPKSISSLREKFDGHYSWHAPFYYFGNYIAATEVADVLEFKPVVMDRFWHSTTAFALAQMKEDYYAVMKSTELPVKGSAVYEWPDDLLKPDIVIFLDVSEEVRNQRLSRRRMKTDQENLLESKIDFRKNVLLAYENMENPGIYKINGNSSFDFVLKEVNEKVKNIF